MNKTIKKQILSALFAAIISATSLILIPSPTGIPITLQTFIVSLSGFLLGWKYGTLAIIIYLTIGTLGLPVFSGLTGGIGVIFGITGGFLIGFIPLAATCGISKKIPHKIIFPILGLIICHVIGIFWFVFSTESNILTAITTVSLPYIVKDIVSVFAAYIISQILLKRIKFINT